MMVASLFAILGIFIYALALIIINANTIPNRETDWLTTFNSYRVSSGVNRVTENPRLTVAAQHHADYLASTSAKFLVGEFENLHKENPASPYYSSDGSTLGTGVIAWTKGKYTSAVDQLMTAPFHAIGILRENLSEVGFGTAIAGEDAFSPKSRITNFSVIAGLQQNSRTKVILFPGPQEKVHVNSFTGENPEPREACGENFEEFYGLPIFASLLHNPDTSIRVTLTLPSGKQLIEGTELCIVTENNFKTSDPIYGPAAKSIMKSENLVLIIPRSPLSEGKHTVQILEKSRPDIKWSFVFTAPNLKF